MGRETPCPHLVGLQEAAIYRRQRARDGGRLSPRAASESPIDWTKSYLVVAADSTTDIELPVFAGLDGSGNPTFDDVRLTDRDAVLARVDVDTANAAHGVYNAFLPPGVREGWSAVDATVGGRTYRFATTPGSGTAGSRRTAARLAGR